MQESLTEGLRSGRHDAEVAQRELCFLSSPLLFCSVVPLLFLLLAVLQAQICLNDLNISGISL